MQHHVSFLCREGNRSCAFPERCKTWMSMLLASCNVLCSEIKLRQHPLSIAVHVPLYCLRLAANQDTSTFRICWQPSFPGWGSLYYAAFHHVDVLFRPTGPVIQCEEVGFCRFLRYRPCHPHHYIQWLNMPERVSIEVPRHYSHRGTGCLLAHSKHLQQSLQRFCYSWRKESFWTCIRYMMVGEVCKAVHVPCLMGRPWNTTDRRFYS